MLIRNTCIHYLNLVLYKWRSDTLGYKYRNFYTTNILAEELCFTKKTISEIIALLGKPNHIEPDSNMMYYYAEACVSIDHKNPDNIKISLDSCDYCRVIFKEYLHENKKYIDLSYACR